MMKKLHNWSLKMYLISVLENKKLVVEKVTKLAHRSFLLRWASTTPFPYPIPFTINNSQLTIIIFYCSHLNFRFNLSLWKQIEMTPVHAAAAKSTRTVVSRNGFKPVMKTAIYAGSYLELLVFFLPWCCGGLWNFSALTTRRWNIINVVIPIAQYGINDKKLLIINWYITQ